MKTCSVDGCDRKHYGRTLCWLHYLRLYRRHKLAEYPRHTQPLAIERFLSSVEINETGCWVWVGKGIVGEYGSFTWTPPDGSRKSTVSHVWIWEYYNGPRDVYPDGHRMSGKPLSLDHYLFPDSCIGPRCCNPDHLKLVTHQENVLRSSGLAAMNAQKTHCIHGHEFNEANTRHRIGSSGTLERVCRTCVREKQRLYRARNKDTDANLRR